MLQIEDLWFPKPLHIFWKGTSVGLFHLEMSSEMNTDLVKGIEDVLVLEIGGVIDVVKEPLVEHVLSQCHALVSCLQK